MIGVSRRSVAFGLAGSALILPQYARGAIKVHFVEGVQSYMLPFLTEQVSPGSELDARYIAKRTFLYFDSKLLGYVTSVREICQWSVVAISRNTAGRLELLVVQAEFGISQADV